MAQSRHSSKYFLFNQFAVDPFGAFSIDKPFGVIDAYSTEALNVRFAPKDPINYHRRVYCLVEHQDALALDLLGTCYNDKRRPATFRPHHVHNYNQRVLNGLAEYGPEQLEELMKDGTIVYDNGVLKYQNPKVAAQKAVTFKYDFPYQGQKLASQYFYENTGENLACTLVDTYVDFGNCSRYRAIESQIIRIRNNTWGRMSCVWVHPGECWDQECAFNVSPKSADISPKGVTEFKISFRPTMDNLFYGSQLECFVSFKSMRNFRLVNEETFTPPWCLTPTVAGNTFPPGKETFIPKVEFGNSIFDFPSCHVDRSVYHPVLVKNSGDTSIKFSFIESGIKSTMGIGGETKLASEGGPAFSVKPRVGVLQQNESKLILLRFSPSEQRLYDDMLTCYFNSSESSSIVLRMHGFGFYPQISFDNTLQLKPTCVGSSASRNFTIYNNSKIAVAFEWCIPQQYASIVAITPTRAQMAPNATLDIQCIFFPSLPTSYVLKIPCYYYHDYEGNSEALDNQKKRSTLTVLGDAILGKLNAKPETVDCGTILVNTVIEKPITVFNPSECDISYKLEIYKVIGSGDADIEERVESGLKESGIEVVQGVQVLSARSNETIRIKLSAKSDSSYLYKVYYQLDVSELSDQATRSTVTVIKARHLLTQITMAGVHPLVSITDIRTEGISKTVLWQMFSLDTFNKILSEIKQDTAAFSEFALDADSPPTDNIPFLNGSDVDFDFGAACVGTKPTVLHISLKNSGVVPVDWVFHFLNDDEIDMELWADPGEYSEDQLKQNFILDNNLFCVVPKAGNLLPGESTRISMSYSHEFAGAHSLPVVFRLKNGAAGSGKELFINFAGYSISPGQSFLHLQSNNHLFQPISIGTQVAPVQVQYLM